MTEPSQAGAVRTFVIADVRGYTAFTQAHGDEAGARLAARFAEVTRECVEDAGGDLVELRGDEALVVFEAPRAALRCAVALQERYVAEMRADASLPLRVGIGIDAGEAVRVEGGFRGGALNLAARLCARAKPGEVLVSESVVLLARRVEGVEYVDQGRVELKGMESPVRYFRAAFNLELPPIDGPVGRPRLRGPLGAVGAAAALALILAAVYLVRSGSPSTSVALAANGVGVLAQNGRIAAEVSIPGPPGGVASGLGHIWVTDPSSNTVRVVDPASASVEGLPIRTGGSDPTGVAVLNGRVWIVNSAQSQVAEVDPTSGGVVRRVGVGNGASAIAAGHGAVWVANSADGTLQRIDAKTARVSQPIPVGAAPSAVAFGARSVWVTDEADGVLYRVNPSTFQVTRIPVGQSPESVAVGFGAVWVANATDNSVTRIALPSLSSRPIPVTAPSGIAVGAGGVWVASLESRDVVRIDPATRTVTKVIPTRNPPGPLTVAGSRVWVTILSAPFSHRGGTLRLGLTSGIDSIDPAVAFTPLSWQMLANTNDGLVGYRRVGGGAGSVLVPDLATTLPTPAQGGRSYTFQLRRGVRYSTGAPVKASDFRFALERALSDPQGPASYFLGAIAGASACGHHGRTCNLSQGVVTDDAAGTVTINLVRPDPDLLEALTLPSADLLPPGSPPANSTKPVPATGPYRVASYVPGRRVLLVRNPYFRQWSAEAQPAGFPNRISWTLGISTPKQVSAVGDGRLDAALGNPDAPADGPASVRLLQNHPDQVHLFTRAQITAFFLNTQIFPFSNVLARRAVSYAMNRNRSLQIAGGTTTARITCQMLPPNIPGYRPYCPYTKQPGSGGWTAPNLARARALAAASKTTQIPVTVHAGGSLLGQARVLVAALRAVGYHAHLALESTSDYFLAIYNPRTRYQAGPWGYIDDYPAPSDFLRYQLGCHQPLNVAHFCDGKIDALIDEAGRLEATDPSRANLLWEDVDRLVTDAAPMVPVLNQEHVDFLGRHVGNYQAHPQWSMLVDQLWVR